MLDISGSIADMAQGLHQDMSCKIKVKSQESGLNVFFRREIGGVEASEIFMHVFNHFADLQRVVTYPRNMLVIGNMSKYVYIYIYLYKYLR